MSSDPEEYLASLMKQALRLQSLNAHAVYRINDNVSDETVRFLVEHFHYSDLYALEVKKCHQCNDTWDIILHFKKQ